MKKLTCTILALLMIVALVAAAPAVLAADPAEHGWDTDGHDFTGWNTADGVNFICDYANKPSSKNDFRIWKDFVEDGSNFDLSLDAYGSTTTDLYIKLMGVNVELKYSGGSGNQFIIKLNGTTQKPDGNDWQPAEGGKATVSLVRKDGGNIQITITPAGGSAINLSAAPTEADNENLEVGLYRGGTAKFENIAVHTTGGTGGGGTGDGGSDTPNDLFGWDTDGKDFTGWNTADGKNFACDYASKPGSKNDFRVWKDLVEDGNNFNLSLDAYGATTTDLYIKLMGIGVELKYSGGSGNQFIIKLNGTIQKPGGNDWQPAEGGKATVSLARKDGGDIQITITPAGGSAINLSAAPTEAENENLEFGLYRGGTAKFENIAVNTAGGSGNGSKSPETGDHVMAMGLLMVVSVIALAAVGASRKRMA